MTSSRSFSTNTTTPRLLDQTDFERAENLPSWFFPVYQEFRRNVLDPKYPCYFGTAAGRTSELRYSWVLHPEDPSLPEVLAKFVAFSKGAPKARHALAVFLVPQDVSGTHADYAGQFWRVLQHLHRNDLLISV